MALDHIHAAYAKMIAEGLTQNPNALEATGIVAQLEDAPNPNAKGKSPKKSVGQKLIDLFKELFQFTDEEEVDSGFIRHCMAQAAKESLKPAGLETWQVLVHSVGARRASGQICDSSGSRRDYLSKLTERASVSVGLTEALLFNQSDSCARRTVKDLREYVLLRELREPTRIENMQPGMRPSVKLVAEAQPALIAAIYSGGVKRRWLYLRETVFIPTSQTGR
jgi:hypothetical protein